MLPEPPHLHLVLPTLGRFKKDLFASIWRDVSGPLPVSRSAATREHLPVAEARGLSFEPVTELPHVWGEHFDQCFWRVEVPADAGASARYLRWGDQGEATVYADGRAIYGFDPGHKRAPLPDGASELLIESICCRSGVWVPGEAQGVGPWGSVFRGAYLAERDDTAWSAYYDFEVALGLAVAKLKLEHPDIVDPLDPNGYRPAFHKLDPEVRRVLRALIDAARAHGTGGPQAVRDTLAQLYASDGALAALDGLGRHEVVLTGNAHVDLVWLWPECVADFKAVHSFANAMSVRERYPEMTFGYSQPASYEAVHRRSPETYDRVRGAAHEGWWEVPGPAYVEFDTQVPCGEALIRAVELGQAGCVAVQGKPSRVLWLPDTFGYSTSLPQVLRGLGVDYFFSTKLFWSDSNVFPYSSFRWVGHDGSEVLAHLSHKYYNLDGEAHDLLDVARHHRQSDVHGQSLSPVGFGDGGGGVTEGLCERARRFGRLPNAPGCGWGSIEGFFDGMKAARDRLPAWHGEMYLAFHRGVATTLSELKAGYRRAERALQRAEAAHVLAGAGTINQAWWKRVCFAQFHDYLPGSSIPRVYEEALPELASIAQEAEASVEDVLQSDDKALAGEAWFNPLLLPQRVWTGQGWAEAPPLSVTPVDRLRVVEAPAVRVAGRAIESGRVRVVVSADGSVESLVVDGESVRIDGVLNALHLFDDRPAVYDAWNLDRASLTGGQRLRASGEPRAFEKDGRAGLSFAIAFGANSTATLRYALRPGLGVLEVELDVDYQEPWKLLKASFGTGYRGMDARFGCPFGSVTRRQLPGPVESDAQHEGAAARWGVVADDAGDRGLMVVSEAKYGMGACDGLLHLGLLRSVSYAGTGGGEGEGMGESHSTGDLTDLGRHTLRYAFGRFDAGAERDDLPGALAECLYQPARRVAGSAAQAGPVRSIEGGPSLTPSWARPTGQVGGEGGVLMRFHETLGRSGVARVVLADGWVGRVASMDGGAGAGDDAVSPVVSVEFGPYQVATVAARRSG
ncbi:MAG: glycoside hydrolase family 38 C-terminal domain-containing protein [Planctomycetota bacterium]